MTFKRSKLDITFYICLFLDFLIFLLPPDMKTAVYGPNLLGWFWVAYLMPGTVIIFLILLVLDIKNKRFKILLKRTLIFILLVGFLIAYWFYKKTLG